MPCIQRTSSVHPAPYPFYHLRSDFTFGTILPPIIEQSCARDTPLLFPFLLHSISFHFLMFERFTRLAFYFFSHLISLKHFFTILYVGLFSTLQPTHFLLIFFIFLLFSLFSWSLHFSLSFNKIDSISFLYSYFIVGCYCNSTILLVVIVIPTLRSSTRCSSAAERRTHNPEVGGSKPPGGSTRCGAAG